MSSKVKFSEQVCEPQSTSTSDTEAYRTRVGHSFIMNDAVHSSLPITGSGVQLTSIPPATPVSASVAKNGSALKMLVQASIVASGPYFRVAHR